MNGVCVLVCVCVRAVHVYGCHMQISIGLDSLQST